MGSGAEMFDLAIVALIGFPFGVLVGYLWRDRISRARRARHRAEQEMRRAAWPAFSIAEICTNTSRPPPSG
jgi:hypothetical protein